MSEVVIYARKEKNEEDTPIDFQQFFIEMDGEIVDELISEINKYKIVQCVMSHSHIAFRTETGEVFRVCYSLKFDTTKTDKKRSKSTDNKPDSIRGSSSGSNFLSRNIKSGIIGRNSRGLNIIKEIQRQGVYRSRSGYSSVHVSEELIENCQAVLQDKSRQVIIKELQRTNLDVNMAVNNLLSRDDESDQGGGSRLDLDDETDEILSIIASRRPALGTDRASDELFSSGFSSSDQISMDFTERRKRKRFDSKVTTGNPSYRSKSGIYKMALKNICFDMEDDTTSKSEEKPKDFVKLNGFLEWFTDPLDENNRLKFVSIAAMHSELICLDKNGILYQWKWSLAKPYLSKSSKQKFYIYHPRTKGLGLLHEKVIQLSACLTRATVMTKSQKFAAWFDETISENLSLSRFEHPAKSFKVFENESIIQVYTSPLASLVHTNSGKIYWWGFYPADMRQKMIDSGSTSLQKNQSETKPTKTNGLPSVLSATDSIVPGVFVCMKNAPILHAGAIGFKLDNGIPKIGVLLEDAWKLSDVCRFRVRTSDETINQSENINDYYNLNAKFTSCQDHSLACPFVQQQASSEQFCGAMSCYSNPSSSAPSPAGTLSNYDPMNDKNMSEMPPPPSPASSTCSEHSGSIKSSPGPYKKSKITSGNGVVNISDWSDIFGPSTSTSSSSKLLSSANNKIPNNNNNKNALRKSTSTELNLRGAARASRSSSIEHDSKSSSSNQTSSIHKRSASIAHMPVKYSQPNVNLEQKTNNKISPQKNASTESLNKKQVEEDWCLKEVVFVEDGRTQPVGIVLKVDGDIVAVKFLKEQERLCLAANCQYSPICSLLAGIVSGTNNIMGHQPVVQPSSPASINSNATITTTTTPSIVNNQYSQIYISSQALNPGINTQFRSSNLLDSMAWLNDCRLLSKNQLNVVQNPVSPCVPDFILDQPVKLFTFSSSNRANNQSSDGHSLKKCSILSINPEYDKIHCIVLRKRTVHEKVPNNKLEYISLTYSGQLLSHYRLPVAAQGFNINNDNNKPIACLTSPSECPLMLTYANDQVFPFQPPPHDNRNSKSLWAMPTWPSSLPLACHSVIWLPQHQQQQYAQQQHQQQQQTNQPSSSFNLVNHQQPMIMPNNNNQRILASVFIFKRSPIINFILKSDYIGIEKALAHPSQEACNSSCLSDEDLEHAIMEHTNGQRNIIHLAINMCQMKSNKECEWAPKLAHVLSPANMDPEMLSKPPPNVHLDGRHSVHDLIMNRTSSTSGTRPRYQETTSSSSATTNTSGTRDRVWHSGSGNSNQSSNKGVPSANNNSNSKTTIQDIELNNRIASYNILRILIKNDRVRPYLKRLFKEQSIEGYTPFRFAVINKNYLIAEFILDVIMELETENLMDASLDEARQIPYPIDYIFTTEPYEMSTVDQDNPLFIICENDTCSFTWTGPDHIKQDIYECRTCGLTDSLCCCTQCAKVCHKGHDCRLKRTSPTAYCDCWERFKCCSLTLGVQSSRHSLFYKLLTRSKLIHLRNRQGIHLLLFLARNVERQHREQKQYRPTRRKHDIKINFNGTQIGEEPEYDLPPPRFVVDALTLALDDENTILSFFNETNRPDKVFQEETYRKDCQIRPTQIKDIDEFVFLLTSKMPRHIVEILLRSFNRGNFRHVKKESKVNPLTSLLKFLSSNVKNDLISQADIGNIYHQAATNFIRSVARVYVSFKLELSNDICLKKKLILNQTNPLEVCQHIFLSLPIISLQELPQFAVNLIEPIKSGLLIPMKLTNQTNLINEAITNLESVFMQDRNMALIVDHEWRNSGKKIKSTNNNKSIKSKGNLKQSKGHKSKRDHHGGDHDNEDDNDDDNDDDGHGPSFFKKCSKNSRNYRRPMDSLERDDAAATTSALTLKKRKKKKLKKLKRRSKGGDRSMTGQILSSTSVDQSKKRKKSDPHTDKNLIDDTKNHSTISIKQISPSRNAGQKLSKSRRKSKKRKSCKTSDIQQLHDTDGMNSSLIVNADTISNTDHESQDLPISLTASESTTATTITNQEDDEIKRKRQEEADHLLAQELAIMYPEEEVDDADEVEGRVPARVFPLSEEMIVDEDDEGRQHNRLDLYRNISDTEEMWFSSNQKSHAIINPSEQQQNQLEDGNDRQLKETKKKTQLSEDDGTFMQYRMDGRQSRMGNPIDSTNAKVDMKTSKGPGCSSESSSTDSDEDQQNLSSKSKSKKKTFNNKSSTNLSESSVNTSQDENTEDESEDDDDNLNNSRNSQDSEDEVDDDTDDSEEEDDDEDDDDDDVENDDKCVSDTESSLFSERTNRSEQTITDFPGLYSEDDEENNFPNASDDSVNFPTRSINANHKKVSTGKLKRSKEPSSTKSHHCAKGYHQKKSKDSTNTKFGKRFFSRLLLNFESDTDYEDEKLKKSKKRKSSKAPMNASKKPKLCHNDGENSGTLNDIKYHKDSSSKNAGGAISMEIPKISTKTMDPDEEKPSGSKKKKSKKYKKKKSPTPKDGNTASGSCGGAGGIRPTSRRQDDVFGSKHSPDFSENAEEDDDTKDYRNNSESDPTHPSQPILDSQSIPMIVCHYDEDDDEDDDDDEEDEDDHRNVGRQKSRQSRGSAGRLNRDEEDDDNDDDEDDEEDVDEEVHDDDDDEDHVIVGRRDVDDDRDGIINPDDEDDEDDEEEDDEDEDDEDDEDNDEIGLCNDDDDLVDDDCVDCDMGHGDDDDICDDDDEDDDDDDEEEEDEDDEDVDVRNDRDVERGHANNNANNNSSSRGNNNNNNSSTTAIGTLSSGNNNNLTTTTSNNNNNNSESLTNNFRASLFNMGASIDSRPEPSANASGSRGSDWIILDNNFQHRSNNEVTSFPIKSSSNDSIQIVQTVQNSLAQASASLIRLVSEIIEDIREHNHTTEMIIPQKNNEITSIVSLLLRRCATVPFLNSSANKYRSSPSSSPDMNPVDSVYQQQRISYYSTSHANNNSGNNDLDANCASSLLSTYRSTSSRIPPLIQAEPQILTHEEEALLTAYVSVKILPIWQWICEALDPLERRIKNTRCFIESQLNVESPNNNSISDGTSGSGLLSTDRFLTFLIHYQEQHIQNQSHSSQQHQQQPESVRDTSVRLNDKRRQTKTSRHHSPPNHGDSHLIRLMNNFIEESKAKNRTTAVTSQLATKLPAIPENTAGDLSVSKYILEIMREPSIIGSDSLESGQMVNLFELFSYRHVAYISDAFMYFFKIIQKIWPNGIPESLSVNSYPSSPLIGEPTTGDCQLTTCTSSIKVEEFVHSKESRSTSGRRNVNRYNSYFRRSQSILSINGPDLISNPIDISLPLAVNPNILSPISLRESLYGTSKMATSLKKTGSEFFYQMSLISENNFKSIYNLGYQMIEQTGHIEQMLNQWGHSLEIFASLFRDNVGQEKRSYMQELTCFTVKEQKFRQDMEKLRNTAKKDIVLLVKRDRNNLILDTVKQLSSEIYKRQCSQEAFSSSPSLYANPSASQSSQNFAAAASLEPGTGLLCSYRLKVSFIDEPAQGSGVNRAFFTAFAESVTENNPLPELYSLMFPNNNSNSNQSRSSDTSSTRSPTIPISLSNIYRSANSSSSSYPNTHLLSISRRNSLQQNTSSISNVPTTTMITTPSSTSSGQQQHATTTGPMLLQFINVPISINSNITVTTPQNNRTTPSTTNSRSSRGNVFPDFNVASSSSASSSVSFSSTNTTGNQNNPGNNSRVSLSQRQQITDLNSLIRQSLPSMEMMSGGNSTTSYDHFNHNNHDEPNELVVDTSQKSESRRVVVKGEFAESQEDILSSERAPLFWQPGISGFYSPRLPINSFYQSASSQAPSSVIKNEASTTTTKLHYGSGESPNFSLQQRTNTRLLIYRTVGRLIGLALLTNETLPINFSRHIYCYLLGYPVNWHDFAFFNPTIFESLRKMIASHEASDPNEHVNVADCDLNMTVSLNAEEGGPLKITANTKAIELLPGGENIIVTGENIYEYVKCLTYFKMIEIIKEPLQQIREGLFDVLPKNSLDGLLPEDLRLLLNGSPVIEVEKLILYTTFMNESGLSSLKIKTGTVVASGGGEHLNIDSSDAEENSQVAKLKIWFWSIVMGLDTVQRQNLLYFWTSSPSLPASEQGFQPNPTITIRPPDDTHWPTANTCISRLYIPLYSKKSILKEKLLQAIQVKSFGFV